MAVGKRIYYLDILRVFACFLVVLTHSQMPNLPQNGKIVGLISLICSPSSELFLALSGAVLLPVRTNMRDFYKRRFLKLLPPMIFWSVFGVMLKLARHQVDFAGAGKLIMFMPVRPVEGAYWFLYVMIGLYLFAPIISCWLNQASKKQVQLFLMLWAFNMIMPWINELIPGIYHQEGSYYWIFCYFGGFLGYWFFGYYLNKYPIRFNTKAGVSVVLLSLLYLLSIVLMKIRGMDTSGLTDNLQIGSAFLVALSFMIIKTVSDSHIGKKYLNNKAASVAQYSFGIYLIHIFVARDLVWKLMENNRMYGHPILESLSVALSTILICLIIMFLCKKTNKSVGEWLFGLK